MRRQIRLSVSELDHAEHLVDERARLTRRDDASESNEFGKAMELLGNDCVTCQTAECYAVCEPYPVDTFRSQYGPWEHSPDGTREATIEIMNEPDDLNVRNASSNDS